MSAQAVADILRRPVPIQTEKAAMSDEDEQAAVGLASILNTPPPTSSETSNGSAASSERQSERTNRKRHRLGEEIESFDAPQLRRSKRRTQQKVDEDEEVDEREMGVLESEDMVKPHEVQHDEDA